MLENLVKTRTRRRETVGTSQKEGLKEEEEEEEMSQNFLKKIVILIIIFKPCTLVHILLTSWTSPVIGTLAEETTESIHTSPSVPVKYKMRYKIEFRDQNKCVKILTTLCICPH